MDERAFLTVDLERLRRNYALMRELTHSRVLATVKANAYGHGDAECAAALSRVGADFLCVATLEEAMRVRAVTDSDILILGWVPPKCVKTVIEKKFTLSLGSMPYALSLIAEVPKGAKLSVHIALNTGMNRIGFDTLPAELFLRSALDVRGIYSHLMSADEEPDIHTQTQVSRFLLAVSSPEVARRRSELLLHLSSSAGALRYGDFGLDAVRSGIALYGHCADARFKPVGTLHARVVCVRELKAGDAVGYGGVYVASKREKIAIASIGYADGLTRANSGGAVLLGDARGTIVGRICMDCTMVRFPHGIEVREGDLLCFYDRDAENTRALARAANTIPYEQYALLSDRVKRIYRN